MQDENNLIAERMAKLDASGIRKVFDLAASMKNPINLSIGQPDFDVPENIREEAKAAIDRGCNKYTQTQGIAELRAAVIAMLQKEFGWKNEPPVLITSGVSGSLLLTFLVLINSGDEVLLLDPYFVMYRHLVNLAGGNPVCLDTYPDFKPDPQKIADAITSRTKLLVLNSPGNPTGAVYSREELTQIAEVARKHNLLVVSDEIYDLFCYDDPFVSMAGIYENTILMRGFSKSYAMTGWRMGWCTGPAAIIEKMTMLQQYSFVCAPSMAQFGAVTALKTDMSQHVAAYKKKRDMVQTALGDKFDLVKPGGAFYAFVPAPKGISGTDFVTRAIENNVLVIPGNVFSERDTHFRISYATADEQLAKGLEVLSGLA